MTTSIHSVTSSKMNTLDPETLKTPMRRAAVRRNLGTAAILGVAASGALISTTWLAVSAGGAFLVLLAVRMLQLRGERP